MPKKALNDDLTKELLREYIHTFLEWKMSVPLEKPTPSLLESFIWAIFQLVSPASSRKAKKILSRISDFSVSRNRLIFLPLLLQCTISMFLIPFSPQSIPYL